MVVAKTNLTEPEEALAMLGKNFDLRVWNVPDTPLGFLQCPGAFTSLCVLPREIVPVRSIPGHMFRQLAHGKIQARPILMNNKELACHFANYLVVCSVMACSLPRRLSAYGSFRCEAYTISPDRE